MIGYGFIAAAVKSIRDEKGLTQAELGNMLVPKVRKQTISYWEKGQKVPSTKYFCQLQEIYKDNEKPHE